MSAKQIQTVHVQFCGVEDDRPIEITHNSEQLLAASFPAQGYGQTDASPKYRGGYEPEQPDFTLIQRAI